jgi:hypothetical protein
LPISFFLFVLPLSSLPLLTLYIHYTLYFFIHIRLCHISLIVWIGSSYSFFFDCSFFTPPVFFMCSYSLYTLFLHYVFYISFYAIHTFLQQFLVPEACPSHKMIFRAIQSNAASQSIS